MAKFKLLSDLYRFPGFVPLPGIQGVFGDPRAVVITFQRRRKKRSAGLAGKGIAVITTSGCARFATSPVATNGCTSPFPCAGSSAPGAKA